MINVEAHAARYRMAKAMPRMRPGIAYNVVLTQTDKNIPLDTPRCRGRCPFLAPRRTFPAGISGWVWRFHPGKSSPVGTTVCSINWVDPTDNIVRATMH